MKRLVSVLLAMVMLAVSLCVQVPAVDCSKTYTYSEFIDMYTELDTRSTIVLEKYPQNGNELVLDLYLNDTNDTKVSAMTVKMDYPEGMTLKSSEYIPNKGLAAFSQNVETKPYTLAAIIGTDVYPSGKTHIARYVFEVDDSIVGDVSSYVSLEIAEVLDLDGNNITTELRADGYEFDPAKTVKSVTVSGIPHKTEYIQGKDDLDVTGGTLTVTYWNGFTETVNMTNEMVWGFNSKVVGECGLTVIYMGYSNELSVTILPGSVPGDANGDGKVNAADVTLLLKHIAKWNVTLDTDAVDVNDDGKINAADVTLMLKYIAKWDVVLK